MPHVTFAEKFESVRCSFAIWEIYLIIKIESVM